MKTALFSLIIAGMLTTLNVVAQTAAPVAGKITYEGMRQIDRSQMRGGNGADGSGASDAAESTPDVFSFTQKLVFAGGLAKEERDRQPNMMMQRGTGNGPGSGNSGPRAGRMGFPVEQTTFLDLTNRQRIDITTVKADSMTTTYRIDQPMAAPENWQLSDKTKKIAGYVCHKATLTRQPQRRGRRDGSAPAAAGPSQTYTIWYTTDLPFTYSPIASLTPEKGVVLQIESDNESFKATNISTEAVPEASVKPPAEAKLVTAEEMGQIRRKAMADFRQKMMGSMPAPNRN